MRRDRTAQLVAEVSATPRKIASHILATTDFARRDRLWPAHFLVFSTNPLNVAYGAAGTALFLRDALGEVPEDVRAWLLSCEVSTENYPPGLFVGMAGIAYTFFEIGLRERAEQIVEACYRSPLRFEDPTMFLGAAGWGLVSLYFFEQTRNPQYLSGVQAAADYLVRVALPDGENAYWIGAADDRVHYGYGFGASGIALFLLRAGIALKRADLLDLGKRGLAYDVDHHVEDRYGWTWQDRERSPLALPYWGHGSSGVGVSALRYYQTLGDPAFLAIATKIAESAYCKWCVIPAIVEGLAGIGDFMIDMFRATSDEEYLDRAFSIAETVLWYAITRPSGVAFPGRWLTRISTDFATGSAGIGMFLMRLIQPGRRFLVDMLDGDPGGTLHLGDGTDIAPLPFSAQGRPG